MIDMRDAAQIAKIAGIVLVVVGVLGFIPNPLISVDGVFATNAAHDILHMIIGGGLIAASQIGRGKRALLIGGIAYIFLGILGYLTMGDLFGIRVNMADHYLHLLFGITLIGLGVHVHGKD